MSYSQPLINQPRILLMSIGVGVLLGIFYAVVQGTFRLLGEGKLSYYLADGIFVTVFTLVSFFFMVLYNEGRVRLHLILGEGAGFAAFYFCAGKYLYEFIRRSAVFLRRILCAFLKPYAFILNSFTKGITDLAEGMREKIGDLKQKRSTENENGEKTNKKFNLFAKIHLKNRDKSV